jgi:hypothetical protein
MGPYVMEILDVRQLYVHWPCVLGSILVMAIHDGAFPSTTVISKARYSFVFQIPSSNTADS